MIKILTFIHAYLQSGRQITENTIITFMNYLTFQCKNFIEANAFAETIDFDLNANGIKDKFIFTDTSTKED
jgi:hypothetical protein